MGALRIKDVTRVNTTGKKNGVVELWAYKYEDSGTLHLALTTENGAGRSTSVELGPEQAQELALYLRGLGY